MSNSDCVLMALKQRYEGSDEPRPADVRDAAYAGIARQAGIDEGRSIDASAVGAWLSQHQRDL